MEPRSATVLDVQRWPRRGSDEWQLMLADFPALELFVSDDGRDLCCAAQRQGAGLGADFFHERRWFARVLGKISAAEVEVAKELIERCLNAAIRAIDPLDGPTGERLRDKIRNPIARRGAQYAGHTLLWRTVPIGVRAEASWSRERILSALIERGRLRGQSRDPTRSRYEQYRSEQRVRALDDALSAQVEDVETAYRAVRLLLRRPARSSSLVESFNARLRVLQQGRRNVSDALLSLLAFRWNASRREEGPRRHESPWQTLGLVDKEDTRAWVELLLDTLPDE